MQRWSASSSADDSDSSRDTRLRPEERLKRRQRVKRRILTRSASSDSSSDFIPSTQQTQDVVKQVCVNFFRFYNLYFDYMLQTYESVDRPIKSLVKFHHLRIVEHWTKSFYRGVVTVRESFEMLTKVADYRAVKCNFLQNIFQKIKVFNILQSFLRKL